MQDKPLDDNIPNQYSVVCDNPTFATSYFATLYEACDDAKRKHEKYNQTFRIFREITADTMNADVDTAQMTFLDGWNHGDQRTIERAQRLRDFDKSDCSADWQAGYKQALSDVISDLSANLPD